MAVLPLVIFPDSRLQTVCEKVVHFDDNLKKEAMDMFDSMKEYEGIGLAANQVGIMKHMFVMDITECKEEGCEMSDKQYCFVNPKITRFSDVMFRFNEGCLSFPEQKAEIDRPDEIDLEYYDLSGKLHKITVRGLACVCIQHEVDHLNGLAMPDRIEEKLRLKMLQNANKIKKKL